jgi:hypothetical protein
VIRTRGLLRDRVLSPAPFPNSATPALILISSLCIVLMFRYSFQSFGIRARIRSVALAHHFRSSADFFMPNATMAVPMILSRDRSLCICPICVLYLRVSIKTVRSSCPRLHSISLVNPRSWHGSFLEICFHVINTIFTILLKSGTVLNRSLYKRRLR